MGAAKFTAAKLTAIVTVVVESADARCAAGPSLAPFLLGEEALASLRLSGGHLKLQIHLALQIGLNLLLPSLGQGRTATVALALILAPTCAVGAAVAPSSSGCV